MNALTEVEQERFSLIESLMDGQYVDARPALMRVRVDGQERAALVAVVTQPSGDFLVDPIAVLVTDEDFGRIDPGIGE